MGIVSGGGGGGAFHGGTVANATTFQSEVVLAGNDGGDFAADVKPGSNQAGGLLIKLPVGAGAGVLPLQVEDSTGDSFVSIGGTGDIGFYVKSATKSFSVTDSALATQFSISGSGGSIQLGTAGGALGVFGNAPVIRPTGVAVTAAGIHAALVTLGLITA